MIDEALAKRFEALVDRTGPNGCWMWRGSTGCSNPKAPTHRYGRFGVGQKSLYAHRVAYELAKGPIPAGLTVDHSCHNPLCVNPDHLVVKTQSENSRNHSAAWREKHRIRRETVRTQCRHGHDLTTPNARTPNGDCRVCKRAASKRAEAKRVATKRTASAKGAAAHDHPGGESHR